MSMILNGKFIKSELCKNAHGGTEFQSEKLVANINKKLLSNFQIHVSRIRENVIDRSKKQILWLHDLPGDPEVQHLKDGGWRQYDKIVFVSEWQMQMYNLHLGIPYSHSAVIHNAIYPLQKIHPPKDGKVHLIYHTTPHRGLEILYNAFQELCADFDNLELDVFSSFKIYGWEQRDVQYQPLFDKLKDHEKINYHGSQPNNVVREQLQKSHIFAYPSIWLETSCLSLMESMSAGLYNVHPNYGALPETAANFSLMYQWQENAYDHTIAFYDAMYEAISGLIDDNFNMDVKRLNMQKEYADIFYNWDLKKTEWTTMLENILEK